MSMSSYQKAMKWYKKHPKGIKLQPLAFNPPMGEPENELVEA